jgi:sugar phosphate isomerase/epimerase
MKLGYVIGAPDVRYLPRGWTGDLRTVLGRVAQAGYAGVELQVRDPLAVDRDDLLRELRRAGLLLAGLSTGPMSVEDRLCLISPSEDIRRVAKERLDQTVELAGQLATHVAIGGIRGFVRRAPDIERGMAWLREAVADLAQRAQAAGATILLEPQNRYVIDNLNTVGETIGFIRELSADAVAVEADTHHMALEERSIPGALAVAHTGGCLAYVQIADSNRRAPGDGILNWADILSTLCGLGYDGWLSMEIVSSASDKDAARGAAYVRALLSETA